MSSLRGFFIFAMTLWLFFYLKEETFTNALLFSIFLSMKELSKIQVFLLLMIQLAFFNTELFGILILKNHFYEVSYHEQYSYEFKLKQKFYTTFWGFISDHWIGLMFFYSQIILFFFLSNTQSKKD